MKTNVSCNNQRYLGDYEYTIYDGEHFITFNLVGINADRNEISIAVSNEGRISLCTFDLMSGDNGLFFFYGVMQQQVSVDDFELAEE